MTGGGCGMWGILAGGSRKVSRKDADILDDQRRNPKQTLKLLKILADDKGNGAIHVIYF